MRKQMKRKLNRRNILIGVGIAVGAFLLFAFFISKPYYDSDYQTGEELEMALDAGVDCRGKTANIDVDKLELNDIGTYNMESNGVNIVFVSDAKPTKSTGGVVIVKVIKHAKLFNKWILTYEVVK